MYNKADALTKTANVERTHAFTSDDQTIKGIIKIDGWNGAREEFQFSFFIRRAAAAYYNEKGFFMDCNAIIQSNDVLDVIISLADEYELDLSPDCTQPLSGQYEILYYRRDRIPPLSLQIYSYSAIPKCFGLVDSASLEESGILQLQNQPALSLRGQGVLVGFLDTGIAYENTCFRNSDGTTRIAAIWDQTADSTPPEGFLYGHEYTREDIDRALLSENPHEIVPQQDEDGHGTLIASIACGSEDTANNFIGAAPLSTILMVKLKPAKPYMRDFFYIPEETAAYQENDIMAAVSYLDAKARALGMPLIICIALGTNNGSHSGGSVLAGLLNYIGGIYNRCVVTATGNEANARHHFLGTSGGGNEPVSVEINVDQNIPGFYLEMWANAPELFAVAVQSPGGVLLPPTVIQVGGHQEYSFLLENTLVEVDYRTVGRTRGDQLVFIRFERASRGIWTVYVYPTAAVTGRFHVWLPMTGMLSGDVFFLKPNPDTTLTIPSTASIPISVGGYNSTNGALYLESGRGYTSANVIKPDFCAPAVNVSGVGLRGNYVAATGTSIAAAITSGACAQIMEWGVLRQNNRYLNSVEIGNILIRGCSRDSDRTYPNNQWGYGKLEAYQAFQKMYNLRM